MESLNALFDWIAANPAWAGIAVFLIALLESLALVGLILPGAAMMFAVGALVGGGALPFWPTALWATAGAVAGDGISFWLGRRYHMQLKALWPLRNHPELIQRSTDFFHRHGGKSVLLGRFVGPIRPVIPAVAGMLQMPRRTFLLVNVASALLWAPLYLLPGVVFASSLGLATEVAGRLALVAGVLFGLLFIAIGMVNIALSWLHRHAFELLQALQRWNLLHPRSGALLTALFDPEHAEGKPLFLLLLLFASITLVVPPLLMLTGSEELVGNLDLLAAESLATLHTPLLDRLFALLAAPSDWRVQLGFALLLGGTFWLGGRRDSLRYWNALTGSTLLLALLALLINRLGEGAVVPSPGLLLPTAMLLFLVTLVGRGRGNRQRLLLHLLATALVLLVAAAALYLGRASAGGTLFALLIGSSWSGLLATAYRHHSRERPLTLRGSSALVGVMLLLPLLPGLFVGKETGVAPAPLKKIEREVWLEGGWQTLPRHRDDLRAIHNHPFNLQYAGELPTLRVALEQSGWHKPPHLSATSWLHWLNPQSPLTTLPVLPQVHDGDYETLRLVRPLDGGKVWLTLRLWASGYQLHNGTPLWVGNLSLLVPQQRGLLTVPVTQKDFARPWREFPRQLGGMKVEKRRDKDGGVVLVEAASTHSPLR